MQWLFNIDLFTVKLAFIKFEDFCPKVWRFFLWNVLNEQMFKSSTDTLFLIHNKLAITLNHVFVVFFQTLNPIY